MTSGEASTSGNRQGRTAAKLGALLAGGLLFAGSALAETVAPGAFAPLPDAPKINEVRARLGAMLFFDTRLPGSMPT